MQTASDRISRSGTNGGTTILPLGGSDWGWLGVRLESPRNSRQVPESPFFAGSWVFLRVVGAVAGAGLEPARGIPLTGF